MIIYCIHWSLPGTSCITSDDEESVVLVKTMEDKINRQEIADLMNYSSIQHLSPPSGNNEVIPLVIDVTQMVKSNTARSLLLALMGTIRSTVNTESYHEAAHLFLKVHWTKSEQRLGGHRWLDKNIT